MMARRSLWLVVMALVSASACADATGPAAADANGRWEGTLSHPSWDGGSLSLSLIDANGVVSGSYQLRLSRRAGSRAQVEQSSGQIHGSSANGRLTLIMERSRGEQWLLEGRLDGSSASGDWSANTTRVGGSFSVSR